jgi:hypothetical protein
MRRAGDTLDVAMLRQCFAALDQKTPEPLAGDAHGAADAAERNPFQEQACAKTPVVGGDAVGLAALDAVTPTVVAVMVLCAVMKVPVFLGPG